jgi:cell division protein FtsQ
MRRDDAQYKEVDLPTRVNVAPERDDELGFEFAPESSLAETNSEPQFRRAERRVVVRRGPIPKKTASRLRGALVAMAVLSLAAAAYGSAYRYGTRNWRFRVESSDDISVQGLEKVTRSQVMDVLGADLGRNVFFIPLEQRKKQIEDIPWVESAALMRMLPNRIAVQIHERTPVAFAQMHGRIQLVDAHGVLMELPRKAHYSFPVIAGLKDSDPLSTRVARINVYSRLLAELDSGGGHYSKDISEVELSDSQDVKVTVADPAGSVLVHLGDDQFLDRYKIYLAHAGAWRQQFQRLESVDLRYDGQIIVNPDGPPDAKQPKIAGNVSSTDHSVRAGRRSRKEWRR